jgi:hypothetical protein
MRYQYVIAYGPIYQSIHISQQIAYKPTSRVLKADEVPHANGFQILYKDTPSA